MTTHRLQVSGMHCASCPLLIDDFLLDVPGVQSARTDLKSGVASVETGSEVTVEQLLQAVQQAGYSAEPIN